MINAITLSCFKQHENLHIDFGAGLVALKGANEAGKSTIYLGVCYALHGSRALTHTLEETVTWGKPVRTLKVQLVFTYEGKQHKIVRSKSGAELTCGDLIVSGQAEVTKFVERLFGVSADVANKIMVANQSSIKGALEDGSAVALIEKLANINLVDDLVTKVQEQLPSGSTKLLQTALEQLHLVPKPAEVPEAMHNAVLEYQIAEQRAAELVASYVAAIELQGPAELEARTVIRLEDERQAAVGSLSLRKSKLTEEVNSPLPAKPESLDNLHEAEAAQVELLAKLAKYKVYLARPAHVEAGYGVVELVQKEIDEYKARLEKFYDAAVDAKVAIAKLGALRITETACGLCGKDLQNVPEVVAKNTALDAAISEHQSTLQTAQAQIIELAEYQKAAESSLKFITQGQAEHKVYTLKLAEWAASLEGYIDAEFNWIGGIMPGGYKPVNYRELLRAQQVLITAYDNAAASKAVHARILADVDKQLSELSVVYDVASASVEIEKMFDLRLKKAEAVDQQRRQHLYLNEAKHALAMAEQQYQHNLEGYTESNARKVQLLADMEEMTANNGLIKRLREARPIIAGMLWASVLQSVSHYFSRVRGVQSIVTRSSAEFLIDGKPASTYSGSTLDSLGLALRMALCRTFLPSIDWMLLDEPASGMDEEREQAMLGLLASSGYGQVVLITHSVLADSVASSVVQL